LAGRAAIVATPIQRKPIVSSPGDGLEREADDVADRVMRLPEPALSNAPPLAIHRCPGCKDDDTEAPRRAVVAQALEGGKEELFSQGLASRSQSAGASLPVATRQSMEHRFGYDFSGVRVHRDAAPAEMSRELGALAFTQGGHIYFADGAYDPSSRAGMRLIAHELTHVIQKGQAAPRGNQASTTIVAVRDSTPTLQRVATWAAGTVHETNNLANCVMTGAPVGNTEPMLNGSQFVTTADARTALARPTLSFSSATTGGISAAVATVSRNTGSFDETVLAKGPWSTVVPKATVGARLALPACTGAGDTTFQAIGKPSDDAMFAANRRHEDHHVADDRTVFESTIRNWDQLATAAKTSGASFVGATEAAAEAALFKAVGGTSDEIADAYVNGCMAAGDAFHATAKGGTVHASNPAANADCSTSSIEATNPS
jgi:hypothetical protein